MSITKLVSALTFWSAVGTAALDEPLKTSLPEYFGVPGSHGGDITPRMVFSHTAGFTGIVRKDDAGNPVWLKVPNCFLRYENHAQYDPTSNITTESCVKTLAQMPLQFHPGTAFEYSDLAFETLAAIVKVKTGLTFEQAFQKFIARPLGLSKSSYVCNQSGSTEEVPHPAIGLCTTSRDYAKVVQLVHLQGKLPNGSVVVPAHIIQQILSHQTGQAKKNPSTDPFFYTSLFGSHCVNSATQNASSIDYGMGAMHHFGFKSEAWMHGSHMGSTFYLAPNRFALFFGISFPGGASVVLPRLLRAVYALESSNKFGLRMEENPGRDVEVALNMCPTSVELKGELSMRGPAAFGKDGRLVKPNQ